VLIFRKAQFTPPSWASWSFQREKVPFAWLLFQDMNYIYEEQYHKWEKRTWKKGISQESKRDKWDIDFYPVVRQKPTSTLWYPPLDKGCNQPLSSDHIDQLEFHSYSLHHKYSRLQGISTTWSLLWPYKRSHLQLRVRLGEKVHTRANHVNTRKTKPRAQEHNIIRMA
jgi:hypothetical protein